MNPLDQIFQQKSEEYQKKYEALNNQYTVLSLVRFGLFVVFILALVYLINLKLLFPVLILILFFFPGFILLVKFHNKIKFQRNQQNFLHLINQSELERLANHLHSFEPGTHYADADHVYSIDLDIFGNHSLFQLINRTNTIGGADVLAHWLHYPSKKQEIIERQEAVKEITPWLDWRQNFEANGKHAQTAKKKIEEIKSWLKQTYLSKNKWLYKFFLVFMVLASITSITLLVYGYSYYWLVGCIAINSLIIKSIFTEITETTKQTFEGAQVLHAYKLLITQIENKEFESARFKVLKNNIVHDNFKASLVIKDLMWILDNLENRANVFYWVLNLLFLLDIYWLIKAESWKIQNRKYVEKWFDTIHEFEAINSIAGFAFANPDFTFPEISDTQQILRATQLGHPLLQKEKRICNDFELHNGVKINIITGSNMSGKSTFLRTIGTNMVLSLMGAPVCANEFVTSEYRLFSSMRTQDNLEESVSSFYAELSRLRMLLDLIDGKKNTVLFILDEILKGTNSHDRHKGSVSLIKQLAPDNCVGFISTHDVELGDISLDLPDIENFSFNSKIVNDEIIFDYKISAGICKSFNASKLMQKIGINIID